MIESNEELAAEELNVRGYAGKWKRAQELAQDGKPQDSGAIGLPYWERVRKLFLELGGERLDGRRV
jgi:hypothetical protein